MIDISSKKQFFIDDALIAESAGVRFEMEPPERAGMVLGCQRPWEAYRVIPEMVLEDGGVYKMWYTSVSRFEGEAGTALCPRCRCENDRRTTIVCRKCGWPVQDGKAMAELFHKCYAESTDGVHWERPDLGLVAFEGSTKNNLIPFVGGACVPTINPRGPAGEKFMAISERDRKLYVSVSGDGIRWTMKPQPVLPFSADTNNQIIYDGSLGKYVAFLRGFPGRRTTVRCEFDTLDQAPWPYQRVDRQADETGTTYIVDELETVMDVDASDGDLPGLDVNHLSATLYSEGVYVGFPGLFRKYPGRLDRRGRERHRYFAQGNDGVFETHLAVSRDGRKWRRPDRHPYVNYGVYGSLDGGFIMIAPGLIVRGDQMHQYYSGIRTTHGIFTPATDGQIGGIFRLVQRRDRFLSISSGIGEGVVLTKPLVHGGSRLQLNVDCAGLGETFVEIQDAAGGPMEGFALDDCDPIDLNRLDATVTWRGNGDVSRLRGRPIRLKFDLHRSKLFTFQFVD